MRYGSVRARVLMATLLAAFAAAGTRLIDAHLPFFSSIWIRLVLVVAILFAIVGLITIYHRLLSRADSGIRLDLEHDGKGRQLRRGLFVAAGVTAVFVGMGVALQQFMMVPVERTLLIGFATGLAWAAIAKPWWFWEHWKAQLLRRFIGDNAVVALYLVMALLLLYAGVFADQSEL